MEKIKGILEEIEPITEKTGVGKTKKPYTLYRTVLTVDKQKYGLSGFEKELIETTIRFLVVRDEIEFFAEHKGAYWNILLGEKILVLRHLVPAKTVPSAPLPAQRRLTDFSVAEIAKQSINIANELLAETTTTDAKLLLQARTIAFQEIMLDRRTEKIHFYKMEEKT